MKNRIKELRKLKKMSQVKLAELLEVSQACVSMWECNRTSPTEMERLKMCKLFNCTPDFLMGYVDINLKEPQEESNTITIGRNGKIKRYKASQKKLQAIEALLEDDNIDEEDNF